MLWAPGGTMRENGSATANFSSPAFKRTLPATAPPMAAEPRLIKSRRELFSAGGSAAGAASSEENFNAPTLQTSRQARQRTQRPLSIVRARASMHPAGQDVSHMRQLTQRSVKRSFKRHRAEARLRKVPTGQMEVQKKRRFHSARSAMNTAMVTVPA